MGADWKDLTDAGVPSTGSGREAGDRQVEVDPQSSPRQGPCGTVLVSGERT